MMIINHKLKQQTVLFSHLQEMEVLPFSVKLGTKS